MIAALPPSTVSELLLRLLVSWLCAQALAVIYARSSGILSYSQNFVQSIVMLALVVTIVMGVVGDSLSRAFGLAAALAIVRFRTPIKDTRDAIFLFAAVAIGMSTGVGSLSTAVIATVVVGGSAVWADWTGFGSRVSAEGILRFRMDGGEAARDQVLTVIRRHCRSFQLTAARQTGPDGPEELVYDIDLSHPESADALVRELSGTSLVSGISLLPLARVGES